MKQKSPILPVIITVLIIIGTWVAWNKGWFSTANDRPDSSTHEQDNNTQPSAKYMSEDGTLVSASFNNTNNTVTFSLPDLGTVTLPQAMSASGARYANTDESLVFWEHQGELRITQNDKDIFVGQLQSTNNQTSSTVVGKTYIWQKTVMSNGQVISPNKPGMFQVTFGEDGRVAGKTDCNSFTGSYKVNDMLIEIGDLASTLMYCEGSQETEFTQSFAKVASFQQISDTEISFSLADEAGHIYMMRK